jgi:Tol biopolymer transport system component
MVAFTVVKSAAALAVVLNDAGKLMWQMPGINCFGWSPDGRHLLVARQSGLYVVDTNGQNLRRLDLPANSWPVWSPDGNALAYVLPYTDSSPESKRLTIIVANLDGKVRQVIRVTPPSWCDASTCRLYTPYISWAPGHDIAFVLVQGDLYPERLYAVGPDGAGQRLLSGKLDDIYAPVWSPDQQRIAFQFRNGTNDQIWTAHANGSGIRQATRINSTTSNLSGCSGPAWSPDSNNILCAGHAGGLYVTNTASGKTRLLARQLVVDEDFLAYSWQPRS